jgi:GTPase SAR1 family protein
VPTLPIPTEYNATQDIANISKEFVDLLNAQKYVVVLEAEISLLMTEIEKQVQKQKNFQNLFLSILCSFFSN